MNKLTADKCREQFEAWFPEMVNGLPKGIIEVFDKMLFTAWEASRAAIEIELPEYADAGDKEDMLEMCRQSVHYSGLKIKGEP